ncbi:MAG: YihY/virulence factor BrkB family protein [Aeromicrobium sp.]
MNWVREVDRYQRRHRAAGFPIAVVYKYFDDHGPYLAAILTYYSFIAIFPLLLISSSILGFVLQDDPELRDRLLNSALSQIPIVGDQLGRPEGLTGSTSAIVVGSVVALYGALGVGQASQHAANVAWSVPRNSRTNAVLQRLRSVVLLSFAGLGGLALAITSLLLANPDAVGVDDGHLKWVSRVAGIAVTLPIFMGLYRLVGSRRIPPRAVLPGAVFATIAWQGLQIGGSAFVSQVVTKATTSQINQTFALVLGLFAFLFLVSSVVVFGHEINVVAYQRLFPRALLTPFTDKVSLTEADRRAYTRYAKSQRHKGFQSIETRFDGPRPERTPKPPE